MSAAGGGGSTHAVAEVGVRTAWGATSDRAALGWLGGLGRARPGRLDGKVVRLGLSEAIPTSEQGIDRLVALAAPALHDAASRWPGRPHVLVLGVPGAAAPFASDLLLRLEQASGVALDRRRSKVVAAGSGCGILALQTALGLLGGVSGPEEVIVGAVDSPLGRGLEVDLSEDLGDEARRQAAEPGPILGECAGFLALSAVGGGSRGVALQIAIAARSAAAATPLQDALRSAAGLGELVEILVDPELPIEWAIELPRVLQSLSPSCVLDAEPTRQLGDLGGAGPLALIALSLERGTCRHRPPGLVGVLFAALDGAGSMVVLQRGPVADDPSSAPRWAPSGATTSARILREGLQARRAELAALTSTEEELDPRAGPELRERVGQALGALGALSASDLADPSHLDRLDEAVRSLQALSAGLPTVEEAIGIDEDLDRLSASLSSLVAEVTSGAKALAAMRSDVVSRAAAHLIPLGPPPVDLEPRSDLDIEVREGDSGLGGASAAEPVDLEAASPSTRALREAERGAADVFGALLALRIARGPGPVLTSSPEDPISATSLSSFDPLDASLAVHLATLEALCRGRGRGETERPGIDLLRALDREAPLESPDPTAAFVRALVLGSLRSDEGPRRSLAALDESPGIVLGAVADGLALARGRRLDGAILQRLAVERRPAPARALLGAAASRRAARFGALAIHLASPDESVRGAAAKALAEAPERDAAVGALTAASRVERSDSALVAMLAALASIGSNEGILRARLALDEGTASPKPLVRLLALGGRLEDVDRLRRYAEEPESLRWWGWLGHGCLVDPLVGVLEEERDRGGAGPPTERALAAAEALQRITGARHEGTKLVKGARVTVDRHDLERDPARWRIFLRTLPTEGRTRYRFGAPHDPDASLAEVEATGASLDDRAHAAFELAVRTGGRVRVREVSDTYALQRAAIEEARST